MKPRVPIPILEKLSTSMTQEHLASPFHCETNMLFLQNAQSLLLSLKTESWLHPWSLWLGIHLRSFAYITYFFMFIWYSCLLQHIDSFKDEVKVRLCCRLSLSKLNLLNVWLADYSFGRMKIVLDYGDNILIYV